MPSRPIIYNTTTLTNAAESAANTETVVCTLSGISTPYGPMVPKLMSWIKLTTGTTASGGTISIRRESLTGTVVGDATADTGQVGASKVIELELHVDDSQRDLGAGTYVVTYKGTGEGTAAAFIAGRLECRVD